MVGTTVTQYSGTTEPCLCLHSNCQSWGGGSQCYVPSLHTGIAAYPSSVNVLEGIRGDLRTPDKLVDGVYDTTEGAHMWLAPLLPGIVSYPCVCVCVCVFMYGCASMHVYCVYVCKIKYICT